MQTTKTSYYQTRKSKNIFIPAAVIISSNLYNFIILINIADNLSLLQKRHKFRVEHRLKIHQKRYNYLNSLITNSCVIFSAQTPANKDVLPNLNNYNRLQRRYSRTP